MEINSWLLCSAADSSVGHVSQAVGLVVLLAAPLDPGGRRQQTAARDYGTTSKLDGVGPGDNRLSTE